MIGPELRLTGVGKRFDWLPDPLLDELSFTVAPGEVLALVGPSGVGKSTLLRMIGGVDTVFTGHVTIDGVEAGVAPPAGFVFQDPRLLPWLTALENIRAVRPETGRDEAVALLARVGLAGYEQAYPHELSGGMQRRVAIARALSVNPRLLLLDEPFVSLDRALAREMELLLTDLLDADHPTAVLVTHLNEDAAMLADRAVVLAGRPARIALDYRFESRRGSRDAVEREHIASRLAEAALESVR
ncbi:MAG: ATP-binding cassette domain-containing protein [Devosia sp.]|nr:ATP-binding cassette domain-containing protein [Devosia sp.]